MAQKVSKVSVDYGPAKSTSPERCWNCAHRYFDTEIEAALARDRKAFELHGEFAAFNFPEVAVGG